MVAIWRWPRYGLTKLTDIFFIQEIRINEHSSRSEYVRNIRLKVCVSDSVNAPIASHKMRILAIPSPGGS